MSGDEGWRRRRSTPVKPHIQRPTGSHPSRTSRGEVVHVGLLEGGERCQQLEAGRPGVHRGQECGSEWAVFWHTRRRHPLWHQSARLPEPQRHLRRRRELHRAERVKKNGTHESVIVVHVKDLIFKGGQEFGRPCTHTTRDTHACTAVSGTGR